MFKTRTKFQRIATPDRPFKFQSGEVFDDLTLAYETHGTLNAEGDNAVLIFHALSGSHHVAGEDESGPGNQWWNKECHLGWWSDFIGPKKPINTKRYFVICANYLGGCYGSSGPSSVDPKTGKPYGSTFPRVSISDVVESQLRLMEHLGVKHLLAVLGASMGGFCVLELAVKHPDMVSLVVPIATGVRATVLAKAMNFEQIFAIEEDRHFNGGNYYEGPRPESGLKLARMISHKTYVSLGVIQARARKEIIQPDDALSGYRLHHQVESYMLHQARKFVERFDSNAYLRIIGAWQDFDLPTDVANGDVTKTFRPCINQRWLLFTINSDVCFYPSEQVEIAEALKANEIDYQHITVHSEKGHDSFLLEPDLYGPYISYKLHNTQQMLQDAVKASKKTKKGGR